MKFHEEEYRMLKTDLELAKYFSKEINRALEVASENYKLPVEDIKNGLEEFVKNGAVYKWVFKKKKAPNKIYGALLECELNSKEFNLFLTLSMGKSLVSREKILTTKPDPIIYKYQFKDIEFENETVRILDEFDNILFETKIW